MKGGNEPVRYLDDEDDECTVSWYARSYRVSFLLTNALLCSDHTLAEAFNVSGSELKIYVGGAEIKAAKTTEAKGPGVIAGIHVRAVTMFIVLTKDQSKWSDIIVGAVSVQQCIRFDSVLHAIVTGQLMR